MAKQTVDALVEGGKASAAPPLGPQLGPIGVNIGQVIAEINKKTADFKGVQVPVKVIVDDDKSFTITVGTPPASALIKQEGHIEKGSGNPETELVADIHVEQVIKIAKMKGDSLAGKDMFAKVKEVAGTCNSMGVMIEGKRGSGFIKEVNEGKFDEAIKAERTELSAEKLKSVEEKKQKLAEEIEKRKAEFTALAKQILEKNEGQPRGVIKAKMVEAKIPPKIITETLPADAAAPKTEEKKEEKKAPAKKKR